MAESSSSVVSNNVNNIQKQSNSDQQDDFNEKNETEKVLEAILLEDHTFHKEPESLRRLTRYFAREGISPSRSDFLVCLIYILMIEYGFVPSGFKKGTDCQFNLQRLLYLSENLPPKWKLDKIYSFTFVLCDFELYKCCLTCIPTSEDMIVNCVVKGLSNSSFNVYIDPLSYFTTSNTQVTTHKLQNLRHLSRIVKSELAFPSKYNILKQNNVATACLEDMPPEIILIIMTKSERPARVALGTINSYFYSLLIKMCKRKLFTN